jgi:hypothetical protein
MGPAVLCKPGAVGGERIRAQQFCLGSACEGVYLPEAQRLPAQQCIATTVRDIDRGIKVIMEPESGCFCVDRSK